MSMEVQLKREETELGSSASVVVDNITKTGGSLNSLFDICF